MINSLSLTILVICIPTLLSLTSLILCLSILLNFSKKKFYFANFLYSFSLLWISALVCFIYFLLFLWVFLFPSWYHLGLMNYLEVCLIPGVWGFLAILLILTSNFNFVMVREYSVWFGPWKYMVLWPHVLSVLVNISYFWKCILCSF